MTDDPSDDEELADLLLFEKLQADVDAGVDGARERRDALLDARHFEAAAAGTLPPMKPWVSFNPSPRAMPAGPDAYFWCDNEGHPISLDVPEHVGQIPQPRDEEE